MSMSKIYEACDGSGTYIPEEPGWEEFASTRYAMCTVCGGRVAVNRSGHLRKHEGRQMPGQTYEVKESVCSLVEMRLSATTLKLQLWHNFSVSHDPRFKRLWQHALALETHLNRIHNDQAYDSASVQLLALNAGDVH